MPAGRQRQRNDEKTAFLGAWRGCQIIQNCIVRSANEISKTIQKKAVFEQHPFAAHPKTNGTTACYNYFAATPSRPFFLSPCHFPKHGTIPSWTKKSPHGTLCTFWPLHTSPCVFGRGNDKTVVMSAYYPHTNASKCYQNNVILKTRKSRFRPVCVEKPFRTSHLRN